MKKIFKLLLMLSITVFIVYNLISLFNPADSTYVVTLETMEKSYKADGFIIRDELQMNIDTKDGGILDVTVSENEMVKKGKHVATYYDSNIDDDIREEIAKINESISKLKGTTDEAITEKKSDKEIDEEIAGKTADIAYASSDRNMAVIASLKSDVNELISQKNADDEPVEVSKRLEELHLEKAALEKKYKGKKTELTAPEHGVFSTRIDGFEDYATPSLALSITVNDYKNAKEKKITADDIRKKGAVCKIVNNSLWYVCVIADEATAKGFTIGDKAVLRFDGDKTTADAKLEYISKSQSGDCMMTFSSSSYCEYAMEYRFASLTMIKDSTLGLKVPISAIGVKDGKTGVNVKTKNTVSYKEVEVISKDDKFAICKFDSTQEGALLLYDEVIVNGN